MKNIRTATNETITTIDGRTVRFEDILEGIRKNVEIYGFNGGSDLSDEDLDDIFQTSARKAWRSATGFNLDKCHGCPQAYGSKIASLVERDAFKKAVTLKVNFQPLTKINRNGEEYEPFDGETRIKGRYQSNELEAERSSQRADSRLESKQNVSYIMDAINSLNERYRNLILLTINGYKPREIAKMLGCEPSLVAKTLFKARKAMKKALGPEFLSDFGLCA